MKRDLAFKQKYQLVSEQAEFLQGGALTKGTGPFPNIFPMQHFQVTEQVRIYQKKQQFNWAHTGESNIFKSGDRSITQNYSHVLYIPHIQVTYSKGTSLKKIN